MSDGPHRTLPLRPRWKPLAARADKKAYTPEQVGEAICPALLNDWNEEIPANMLQSLRDMLGGNGQAAIFADQLSLELQNIRSRTASPMEALLIDCVSDALADGGTGDAALERAVEATLREQYGRQIRSVEEHYLREARNPRASNVRARLESSLAKAPLVQLVRSLLSGVAKLGSFKPLKHTGLDEGVHLR